MVTSNKINARVSALTCQILLEGSYFLTISLPTTPHDKKEFLKLFLAGEKLLFSEAFPRNFIVLAMLDEMGSCNRTPSILEIRGSPVFPPRFLLSVFKTLKSEVGTVIFSQNDKYATSLSRH